MNANNIAYPLGAITIALGLFLLIPGLVDMSVGHSHATIFFTTAMFAIFTGVTLVIGSKQQHSMRITTDSISLNAKEAFFLSNIVWLVLIFFSAIPFYFATIELSFADAIFEATSGITTTGSTVISQLEEASSGIIVWRSILQWIGGVGILVMALTIFPMLGIGGMQLFRTTFLSLGEKSQPRVFQISVYILVIYIAMTVSCFFAYLIAGMTPFEAINYAMTTVSTGGFAPYNESIAYFDNPSIEIIAVIFMILAALPFVIYMQAIKGRPQKLWQDHQVQWFFILLLLVVAFVTLYLMTLEKHGFFAALRSALFNVTAIMTGTGYVTEDYSIWGNMGPTIFLVIMFIGGCAGSTTCAIKLFRIQVLWEAVRIHLRQLHRPDFVYIPNFNGQPIDDKVIISVTIFLFAFFMSIASLAVILGFTGLDFMAAISSAVTAVANVGPALGNHVGPNANFSHIPEASKLWMSFGMLLGRLEILMVLTILMPRFWRT